MQLLNDRYGRSTACPMRIVAAALALFKSNSFAGLLLFLAFVAGMWKGPLAGL